MTKTQISRPKSAPYRCQHANRWDVFDRVTNAYLGAFGIAADPNLLARLEMAPGAQVLGGKRQLALVLDRVGHRDEAVDARLAGLNLKAKVITHTRCHMDDARAAVRAQAEGMLGTQ